MATAAVRIHRAGSNHGRLTQRVLARAMFGRPLSTEGFARSVCASVGRVVLSCGVSHLVHEGTGVEVVVGPITLFDKSFLQSLSVDESVWVRPGPLHYQRLPHVLR